MKTTVTVTKIVRLFLLCKCYSLVVALLSASTLQPYLASTELFLQEDPPLNRLDGWVKRGLAPFARWDSIYFLRIATHGYQYEQQHAFFPLLPHILRSVGRALAPMGLSLTSGCLVAGVVLSNLCHFLTITNVYRLSLLLGADESFAFVASAFATLSPAYPFLSAIYTESLFAFLATSGMMLLCQGQRFMATLLWSLASLTRSNGVLLAGFFIFNILKRLRSSKIRPNLIGIMGDLAAVSVIAGASLSFQYYGYQLYCVSNPNPRPWCRSSLPNIYNFVQSHYWNVGFLKYYRLEQIPNFILATPMIVLSAATLRVGLQYRLFPPKRRSLGSVAKLGTSTIFTTLDMVPHLLLLAFMLAYAASVVHVQIIPRLFSFMPIISWSLAHFYTRGGPLMRKLLLGYCLFAGAVGTLLYSNFYPPA